MMRNRRNEANTLIGILKDESQKALSWLEDLGTTNLYESPADIKARMALNNTKETCEKLLELLFPDKTASGNPKFKKFIAAAAHLDEIAGELEAVDPRLALALDMVSDKLENRTAKGSFSDHMLALINKGLDKFLADNKEHVSRLSTEINDANFWKILDKEVEKGASEEDLYDKLDRCPEWKKLTEMNPDYASAKEWRDDIKKLEDWVRKSF